MQRLFLKFWMFITFAFCAIWMFYLPTKCMLEAYETLHSFPGALAEVQWLPILYPSLALLFVAMVWRLVIPNNWFNEPFYRSGPKNKAYVAMSIPLFLIGVLAIWSYCIYDGPENIIKAARARMILYEVECTPFGRSTPDIDKGGHQYIELDYCYYGAGRKAPPLNIEDERMIQDILHHPHSYLRCVMTGEPKNICVPMLNTSGPARAALSFFLF